MYSHERGRAECNLRSRLRSRSRSRSRSWKRNRGGAELRWCGVAVRVCLRRLRAHAQRLARPLLCARVRSSFVRSSVRPFVRSFVRDFTVLESPFSGKLLALSRDVARFPRALRPRDLQDYSFCLGRIRKRPVSDQWDFKSAQFAPLRSFATADSLASAPFRDSGERKSAQITAKRESFAASLRSFTLSRAFRGFSGSLSRVRRLLDSRSL